jgi:protein SHQ1
VLETSLYKPYGFLNAYTGYFIHVATTENEVNELGADAETLTPSERRIRRLKREDEKWDPEYYMYVLLYHFPFLPPKTT